VGKTGKGGPGTTAGFATVFLSQLTALGYNGTTLGANRWPAATVLSGSARGAELPAPQPVEGLTRAEHAGACRRQFTRNTIFS
jgi:hypothetical protein